MPQSWHLFIAPHFGQYAQFVVPSLATLIDLVLLFLRAYLASIYAYMAPTVRCRVDRAPSALSHSRKPTTEQLCSHKCLFVWPFCHLPQSGPRFLIAVERGRDRGATGKTGQRIQNGPSTFERQAGCFFHLAENSLWMSLVSFHCRPHGAQPPWNIDSDIWLFLPQTKAISTLYKVTGSGHP